MKPVRITPSHAVAVLNRALRKDPVAVSRLVSRRARCNLLLADDRTIQVRTRPCDRPASVGMLGIINGIFGATPDRYGWIYADVHKDGRVVRFGLRSLVARPPFNATERQAARTNGHARPRSAR